MTDKVQKIREKVEKLILRGAYSSHVVMNTRCKEEAYNEVLAILDKMQEEPVSEELEEAAKKYGNKEHPMTTTGANDSAHDFKAGAKWQREHLFKSADGEDLPKLEKDVVVLVDNFGKLIPKIAKRTYHLIEKFVDEDTGEIISIENTNEVGDVINWTEPAVYWLDVSLPKLQED